MSQSPITTHILDTHRGRPAVGVAVTLEALDPDGRAQALGSGVTNEDGRVTDLLSPGALRVGNYRLRFAVGAYFAALDTPTFYPEVDLTFRVDRPEEHYHVPLLLSPFGYTTYRGS